MDLTGKTWKEAEENCKLRSSSVIRVIKSRRIRWAGLVAHMGR
jgi:hypothetical protein